MNVVERVNKILFQESSLEQSDFSDPDIFKARMSGERLTYNKNKFTPVEIMSDLLVIKLESFLKNGK